MGTLMVKNAMKPDESRQFAGHGRLDVVKVGDVSVGRGTFEPGWRWSTDVKPLTGTQSCQASHAGYCISGRMLIKMDSGEEREIGPGDCFYISPGHDAWVIGNEPCVLLDFTGAQTYAAQNIPRRTETARQPAALH